MKYARVTHDHLELNGMPLKRGEILEVAVIGDSLAKDLVKKGRLEAVSAEDAKAELNAGKEGTVTSQTINDPGTVEPSAAHRTTTAAPPSTTTVKR